MPNGAVAANEIPPTMPISRNCNIDTQPIASTLPITTARGLTEVSSSSITREVFSVAMDCATV